jgi:hypothetical protein
MAANDAPMNPFAERIREQLPFAPDSGALILPD